MTAVVEMRDIAAGWGTRTVVAGITLAVAPGERVAIVGANGCGKTTVLRVLAGLTPPQAGTICWQGKPLPAGAARVRVVGVLFQREVAATFSVREIVTLGLGLDGPPSVAARRRVDEVLALAGVATLAERTCATLSGGELQRVLLARALVADATLLVLDEPTNHLDPARQASLLGQLDSLRPRVAVVLATHDLGLAATCDRVLLLGSGRVAALGRPHDVLSPVHLEAALGASVQRLDDPRGGPPLFRVLPVRAEGVA